MTTLNLKDVELANRACGSLEELAAAVEQGIGRERRQSELLFLVSTPGRAFPLSITSFYETL